MSAIPHTAVPRRDTGLYNAKVGTWLFLAAEAMFFGALVSSYVFLRSASAEWPAARDVLPVGYAAANVIVLILLAIASVKSRRAARAGKGPTWLWICVVLAVCSVALVALEHRIVGATGARASTSTFYGMYYLLSGIVRTHVGGGAVATAWIAGPCRHFVDMEPIRHANWVECLGYYWLFVVAMSLATFFLVYLA